MTSASPEGPKPPPTLEQLGARVSAARQEVTARGETFYPGPSRVHLAAFLLLVAATTHLLTAGSDRASPAVLAMLAAAIGATTFLLLFCLLHQSRHNRPDRASRPCVTVRWRPPVAQ